MPFVNLKSLLDALQTLDKNLDLDLHLTTFGGNSIIALTSHNLFLNVDANLSAINPITCY